MRQHPTGPPPAYPIDKLATLSIHHLSTTYHLPTSSRSYALSFQNHSPICSESTLLTIKLLVWKRRSHSKASSTTSSERSSPTFSYPTLAFDGTASTYRQRTPPAALSSLAAKMASKDLTQSISSLDNDASYDMVDDLSELSSDDHDTVSITSTANDEEQDFEEQDGRNQNDDVAVAQELEFAVEQSDKSVPVEKTSGEALSVPPTLFEDQAFKVRMPFPDELGLSATQESTRSLIDDSTDELETPRQSTIAESIAYPPQSTTSGRYTAVPVTRQRKLTAGRFKKEMPAESPYAGAKRWQNQLSTRHYALLALILMSLSILLSFNTLLSPVSPAEPGYQRVRRAMTETALKDFAGHNPHLAQVNMTHLFPEHGSDNRGTFRRKPSLDAQEIRYQALQPNHLLVSLPPAGHFWPRSKTTTVRRGTKDIEANTTELVPGIIAITIDEDDAYGQVSYGIAFVNPTMAISVTHDFGNRLLQRHTYEKAGTELTKAIAKDIASDIAIARDVAKTVTGILQPDIEGHVRNVSLMIRSAATDLIVITDKALDNVRQAEKKSKKAVKKINKDLMVVTKDLYTAFQWAAGNVSLAAVETINSIMPLNPLSRQGILLARERALMISQRFLTLEKKAIKAVRQAKKERGTRLKKVKADLKALRRKQKVKKAKVSDSTK